MKKIALTENKKKVIVLCSMVVLLVVAGTLNIVLNMNLMSDNPGTTDSVATFYTELSANRELRKNEQLVLLDSIINNENSTADAIKQAEEQKLAICENIQKEMVMESVIKSKGYDNVAVVIGNDGINIFVDKAQLSDQEMAVIMDIVTEHTDFTVKDVSISPTVVE